ncbi:ureidoglycolate lyase [Pelagibacterium mangrovi]|uniref:ureidoglycolate lyase n=1 Tax=Pelagibacterium mangrovi TaxID=3119828 RepID=UPI002FCA5C19
MSRVIIIRKLTADAFAPFGQVLATKDARSYLINGGMTERFHDLANVEIGGENGRTLISIFRGQPYDLPLTLRMVERHPLGSQAFMPLHDRPFLVIVAPDEDGVPGTPLAFLTEPGIGVNIGRNVWHGVLTPLEREGDFLVVDRGGEGNNLEEYFFENPFTVSS